jgi:hypothetical protein
LPGRKPLVTLRDAGIYITKLPKAEHQAPEWQAAMEALIVVAEKDAMGQRRDSCKIVASINLQLTEPPNAETPRQQ